MKKFFSLVLALVMALSLTTVAWGATPVANFSELKTAITNGDNDIVVTGKIILTEDLSLTNVTINTGSVEDAFEVGAGYTLTLGTGVTINAGNSILYANGGTININGATLKSTSTVNALGFAANGGTINMNSGSVTAYWTGLTASGANSKVNILDGTVESTNSNATLAKNNGTTTITGGVIKSGDDFATLWAKADGVLVVDGDAVISSETGAAISVESATATVSAGTFSGHLSATGTGSITVTGGTFDSDVSAHVDADSGFTNNGDGTYTVAVKSANTSLYDLYEGDETLYLEDVYRTKFAAKKLTKTQVGQVAGWDIEGTFYVEITKAEATQADFYLTKANKDAVVVYLREAENHGMYTLTGKAYDNYNEGDDNCGEWNYDPELVAMYKDDVDGDIYTDLGDTAYMLVGKTVVGVALADEDAYMVDHQMEGVYNDKDKLVGVKCAVCGATGKVYESVAKVPFGADYDFFDGLPYVLNKVAVKPADTETKVESAETFDAGIAMYVGMSVMAAAGSAVVIGKKKD